MYSKFIKKTVSTFDNYGEEHNGILESKFYFVLADKLQ